MLQCSSKLGEMVMQMNHKACLFHFQLEKETISLKISHGIMGLHGVLHVSLRVLRGPCVIYYHSQLDMILLSSPFLSSPLLKKYDLVSGLIAERK